MKRKQPADPQMMLGDTPVSCRKRVDGRFISVADEIEVLVAGQPGLTESEIANRLFASEGHRERVHMMCRRLIAEGRLSREGAGNGRSIHLFNKRASPTRAMAKSGPWSSDISQTVASWA